MTPDHGRAPLAAHEHYAPDYFRQQIAKSDAKITWEYERLLHLAGVIPTPATRVLDLGCGAAPGLRYFAARGVPAIGVDVAPAALHEARALLPDSLLVCADLDAALPFADGAIDLIVLREVVEHLQRVSPLLAECRRVLRPGGRVALTTPNRWDMRRPLLAAAGRVWSGDADSTHVTIFDPPAMRRALRDAGLVPVSIRAGFKPMLRLGGRRLPRQIVVPYPPLVGNGLVAVARR